ncbi:MAG: M50 family metallopeptidase [Planctomycetota bacterium]
MLIGEPMPSQYDWRFNLFGFPIRVTWLFWLINAALGYSVAMSMDNRLSWISQNAKDMASPGIASLLVVWVAAAFLSILIHELGHALMFRVFGIDSQIVLYHMGGLAIPTAGYAFRRGGNRARLTHGNQILISAAGPGLQFATALAVATIAHFTGMQMPIVVTIADWLGFSNQSLQELIPTGVFRNAWLYSFVDFFVLIGLWWPLFNLLPVYPLDGGHITQHIAAIVRRTDGLNEAYLIGAITGFVVAWWFFTRGSSINAMLFLSLAMSNVQAVQQRSGPFGW